MVVISLKFIISVTSVNCHYSGPQKLPTLLYIKFNRLKFCVLFTEHFSNFFTDLRTISDYFPTLVTDCFFIMKIECAYRAVRTGSLIIFILNLGRYKALSIFSCHVKLGPLSRKHEESLVC